MALDDDTQMSRLYQDGASIRDTASACGLAPKTVHRRLQAAGVPRRRPGGSGRGTPPARLTPDQVAEAARTYAAGGVSLHGLGAAYGVSGDTMGRKLRAAGTAIRPRGRVASAVAAPASPEVLRLHEAGHPPRDIAARLGRNSTADVAQELRRAGLTPHHSRPIPPPQDLAVAYARTGSLRRLSASLRTDEARLKAALATASVPVGSLRRVPAELRPAVAQLAAAGASAVEISARTGLSATLFPQLGRPDAAHGNAA